MPGTVSDEFGRPKFYSGRAMNPHFQARLVNDPFGDPALYVAFTFRRRALLFDLGDLRPLSPREILAVEAAFVSHTHLDHFCGFDTLLRLHIGREKTLALFGPAGFIGQVGAKLAAYTWNLAPTFEADLVFTVTEIESEDTGRAAEFRLRERFARRDLGPVAIEDRTLVAEPDFRVRFAILDHGVPCLAFALEESRHVNVWRNEVEAMDLPVGPWLADLKAAVHRDEPDDLPMRHPLARRDRRASRARTSAGRTAAPLPLRGARPAHRLCHGRAAPTRPTSAPSSTWPGMPTSFTARRPSWPRTPRWRRARGHLTAYDIGTLARRAGARRLIPFHYSPRYSERAGEVEAEARKAFTAETTG